MKKMEIYATSPEGSAGLDIVCECGETIEVAGTPTVERLMEIVGSHQAGHWLNAAADWLEDLMKQLRALKLEGDVYGGSKPAPTVTEYDPATDMFSDLADKPCFWCGHVLSSHAEPGSAGARPCLLVECGCVGFAVESSAGVTFPQGTGPESFDCPDVAGRDVSRPPESYESD